MSTVKKISSASSLASVSTAQRIPVIGSGGAVSQISYAALLAQLKTDLAQTVGGRYRFQLPAKKGVRITFSGNLSIGDYAAIVSVRTTNGNGSLMLMGNGYGGDVIRNSWTRIDNKSASGFSWGVPPVDNLSRSIEILSTYITASAVSVLSIDGTVPTFTLIDALTTA